MESRTITTTVDLETFNNLSLLAETISSSKSILAAEAIRIYIEEQKWQIEAIKKGLEQAEADAFASEENVKSAFSKWGVDVEKNKMA